MDRFKSILVAASPGHLELVTLRAAIKLAERNDARLTVLDVVPPVSRLRRRIAVEDHVVDITAALVADRQERLRRLVDNTQGAPDTDVEVKVGEPFLEVIRHVLTHGNDLVMVGGREVHRPEVPGPSSGVMHLLRKSPVPVWMMRPSRAPKLRILALTDPDPEDPVRDSLNDLVMELATSLTRREGGELHLGHAWSLEGEAALSTLRAAPHMGKMVETAETSDREQGDLLTKRLDEIGGSVHMVAGEADSVLPRLAERLDIGLIVMGTVARTGLSRLIMGNTAEAILCAVRCSVLVVKPEGFVTPVKPARPANARSSKGER